jgi:hypothetical protein
MSLLNQLGLLDNFRIKKPQPKPEEKPKETVQKQTVKKDPPPPKDDFGPVVERPTLTPAQYPQINIKSREPISPEKLKEAADMLGIFAKREAEPIPDFNIDDLKQKLQNFNPGDLPLDLRSIGAATDAIYGTKLAQTMPDSRSRTLEDLQAIRQLGGDSQALQQVQAQGRLAKYKEQLKRMGTLSPVEYAHALKYFADAIGGGGNSTSDYKEWQQAKAQADANQAAEKSNLETKNKLTQDIMQQQKDWAKDPTVTATREIFLRGRSLRDSLSTAGGAGDQQAIITYLHMIEPDSVVMKSEGDAMKASAPILDRLKNIAAQLKRGDKIPPSMRRDILKLSKQLEDAAEQDYRAARQGKGEALSIVGIDPKSVLGPVDKTVTRDTGVFEYKMPDGSTVSVPANELGDFIEAADRKSLTVMPLGRRKK